MATNKKPQNTRRKTQSRPKASKPKNALTLAQLFKKRKKQDRVEFKPDSTTATWIKTLRLTQLQQLRLTKWALYILTIILCQVVQDVIMSQATLFGATTDLAVCAIFLIIILEGSEVGSLFALIASIFYYYSGTAPGAYCIALITILGIAATIFRQMYWHRSPGSIVLCSALALTGYEMGLLVVGLSSELTNLSRIPSFVLRCLFSCIALIPLYFLIHRIGLIGGNTWKE